MIIQLQDLLPQTSPFWPEKLNYRNLKGTFRNYCNKAVLLDTAPNRNNAVIVALFY